MTHQRTEQGEALDYERRLARLDAALEELKRATDELKHFAEAAGTGGLAHRRATPQSVRIPTFL